IPGLLLLDHGRPMVRVHDAITDLEGHAAPDRTAVGVLQCASPGAVLPAGRHQPRAASTTRATPNTTKSAAAPARITRSGSRDPSALPAPMASASAATMPTVEPAQVPITPLVVARVIVASIVLSPSSARKNAALAATTA